MIALNDPAPDFSGQTVNGLGHFKLSDYIGKTVVISISGLTWCGYCKREAPMLQRLWEAKRGDGIQFISATKDGGPLDLLQQEVENLGITFPVVRRTTAAMGDYEGPRDGVPLLYILNRDHKVCYRHDRYFGDEMALSDQIDQCRAAPAPNTEVGRGCGMVLIDLFKNIGRQRR